MFGLINQIAERIRRKTQKPDILTKRLGGTRTQYTRTAAASSTGFNARVVDMNTAKIKTSELSGKALDWAVGQCACENDVVLDVWSRSGFCVTELVPFSVLGEVDYTHKNYHPSTDWSQCGPLIDDYDIEFVNQGTGIIGAYAEFHFCPYEDPCGTGDTHLVAACRAIVAAELGDEVEIPEELVG